MAVVIDSGSVEAEDLLRHVPTRKWRELMLARRRFLEIKLSHDCRCLVQFVNDAKLMFSELGFKSPEAMIRDGYGLEPQEIQIAVDWLELNPPTEPVGLETAIKLARQGRPKKGEEKGGVATFSASQRNTKAHILARLERDGHDELAAKVRSDEMSANAAAHQIGYRKKLPPLEKIQKLWDKLDRDGRKAHLEWTLNQCATCGRPGTWDGWGEPSGSWCDACCEEGAAASYFEGDGAT